MTNNQETSTQKNNNQIPKNHFTSLKLKAKSSKVKMEIGHWGLGFGESELNPKHEARPDLYAGRPAGQNPKCRFLMSYPDSLQSYGTPYEEPNRCGIPHELGESGQIQITKKQRLNKFQKPRYKNQTGLGSRDLRLGTGDWDQLFFESRSLISLTGIFAIPDPCPKPEAGAGAGLPDAFSNLSCRFQHVNP